MLNIVISFLSGIFLSLAFPRVGIHWLAWFALAPLMYYMFRLTWKGALICSAAFGIGFFASLLYWIAIFGKLPWIAFSVFQALFIVAFAASGRLIGERLGPWGRFLLLPALWVIFEWVRSLGALGLTWGDIGYSQYKLLSIVQIASVTGVWGVSFLLALSNSALANLIIARRNPHGWVNSYIQIFAVCMAALLAILFGLVSTGAAHIQAGRKIRAVVVQGNVNSDVDGDIEYRERIWRRYSSMTLEREKDAPEFIVWPEAAVPGTLGRDSFVQNRLSLLASAAGAYMLVGGRDADDGGRVYNSAFLIRPGTGIVGRYSKVHLVPFGEYVLWRRYLPFLRFYRVTSYDLSPGPGYRLMDTGGCRVGTAICFESTFPGISRRMAASGAELLCVITNDSWFGWTAAAEQHMSMSVFRAVENGRYVLRAAATGISCVIDPRGRILTRAGLFRPAVLKSDIRILSGKTFYTRHGDWFVYASFALAVLLTIVSGCKAWCLSRWRS